MRSRVRFILAVILVSGLLALTGCATVILSEVLTPTPTATLTPTSTPLPTHTPNPTATPRPTVTLRPSPSPTPISTSTRTAPPSATPVAVAAQATGRPPTPVVNLTPCPCGIEHVVLISIDGLRPDALAKADTPVLDGLRARGAYSPSARSVLPSVTLVNHASMVGGMGPNKHGITWNDDEPERRKIKGPTAFSVLHQAGLSTAMVVGKPKLEQLDLPGSVDTYIYAGYTDKQVVARALPIIQAGLPRFLFIHLPDVDTAGHASGWMSPNQLTTVGQTDTLIGQIVAALEAGNYMERTLLIITADHGGSGQGHGSASPEDSTVPWLVVGPSVPRGVTLTEPIIIYDTAATILRAFGLPIPDRWDGRPVMQIFQPVG